MIDDDSSQPLSRGCVERVTVQLFWCYMLAVWGPYNICGEGCSNPLGCVVGVARGGLARIIH